MQGIIFVSHWIPILQFRFINFVLQGKNIATIYLLSNLWLIGKIITEGQSDPLCAFCISITTDHSSYKTTYCSMYFHFFKASHKYEPQGFLQFPTVHLSKPREFKSKDFISLQTSLITLNFFLIIVLANKFRATKLVQEIIFLLLPDNKNLLNICIYLR